MKKLDNTLIIGIGNNTRQDDGLGWGFIELLENYGFNTEHLLCKYQLMVEDAELISNYKNVIFVDACKSELKKGFTIEPILATEQVTFSTHEVPPNQILHLCESIYNKKPIATLIKIQGYNWDFEIQLSEQAKTNLNNAFYYFLNKSLSLQTK
jgi:hydrogenase maturation protease